MSQQTILRDPRRRLILAAAVSLLLAVAVIGTAWALSGRPNEPVSRPMSQANTVSGHWNGQTEASFELSSGAESITVHSSDLGDLLYVVSTLPGSSVRPTVSEYGDHVGLRLDPTGDLGKSNVHIQLNAKVRWQLRLARGGLEQVVDFGSGQLSDVELAAGVGTIDLTIAKPAGTLPIHLSGGGGELSIHVPSGPPARVSLAQSVGVVTVDGTQHTSTPPDTVLTPPGWDQATDRYDISATAPIANLTVDRR